MKTNWKHVGLPLVLLAAVVGVSRADYVTGFETSDNPGYVAGSTIDGVDGWTKTNGLTTDNLVTSDVVNSGTQAMRLGRNTGGTAAWASASKTIDALDDSHVIADVYMASQADVVGSYIYFGGSTAATANAAAQFGFTSGNQLRYRDGSSDVVVPDVTYQANTYYHFVADIDLVNKAYDLTITGPGITNAITITGVAFRNSGVDEIGWVIALNSSASGAPNRLLWVDDLSITPEPATMALLSLGTVGLLRRRRGSYVI